eukprot:13379410-Alexandrium_andersonii.AAC.1
MGFRTLPGAPIRGRGGGAGVPPVAVAVVRFSAARGERCVARCVMLARWISQPATNQAAPNVQQQ